MIGEFTVAEAWVRVHGELQPRPLVSLRAVASGARSRFVKEVPGVVAAATVASVVVTEFGPACVARTPVMVPPCWVLELPQGWLSSWVRSYEEEGTRRGQGWSAVLAVTVLVVDAVSPAAIVPVSVLPFPDACRVPDACAGVLAVW